MRKNLQRRVQLLDAAIELLAREGARGLSYRAVEAEAGLPTGTASNYFRNRTEMLLQVGERVHARLQPEPQWLETALTLPPGKALLNELLQNLVKRVLHQPSVYLALLELRLEATRLPELRALLSQTILNNFRENERLSHSRGLALPPQEFTLMYLAVSGLLIEELTLPAALETPPSVLVETLVNRFF